jgi:hypothetical protein
VFSAADVSASAPFPRSASQRFSVERDGTALGWVTVPTAELLDRRVDPMAHIAARLNDLERERGFDELASALAGGLELA